jgi:hypothetical protein
MSVNAIILDLLSDYCKIVLIPPPSTKGLKKLSFVLPGGDRKKLMVEEDSTFGEVLGKLECGPAYLFFDGYPLDPRRKIKDCPDIEDGDQIDVRAA